MEYPYPLILTSSFVGLLNIGLGGVVVGGAKAWRDKGKREYHFRAERGGELTCSSRSARDVRQGTNYATDVVECRGSG